MADSNRVRKGNNFNERFNVGSQKSNIKKTSVFLKLFQKLAKDSCYCGINYTVTIHLFTYIFSMSN